MIVGTGKDGEEERIMVLEFPFLACWVAEKTFAVLIRVARDALVYGIHLGPAVFVALQAGEILAIARIWMAGETIVPCAGVLSGENGKEQIVMVFEILLFTGGMAAKTVDALIRIAGNILMLFVHL